MPLPESSEYDAASGLAGQEPTPEAPVPGAEMVPAMPRKPRKFSKLVLVTASKDSAKVASVKRRGVHCIMSLGVPGTATLTKALLQINPQRAIEAPQPEPERKRRKLDPGERPGMGLESHGSPSPLPPLCTAKESLALSREQRLWPDMPLSLPDGKEDGSPAGPSAPSSSAGEEGATAHPVEREGSPKP